VRSTVGGEELSEESSELHNIVLMVKLTPLLLASLIFSLRSLGTACLGRMAFTDSTHSLSQVGCSSEMASYLSGDQCRYWRANGGTYGIEEYPLGTVFECQIRDGEFEGVGEKRYWRGR